MEKVSFKNVVRAACFDLLASVDTPLPCEFESLTDSEKLALYRSLFEVIHDTCTLLSSALCIDILFTKYDVYHAD